MSGSFRAFAIVLARGACIIKAEEQTCHFCPATELGFIRNQPRTTRHSVIAAPVAPGAQ